MLFKRIPQPPSFEDFPGPKPTIRSFGPLGPFYPQFSSFDKVGREYVPPLKPWTTPDLDQLPCISDDEAASKPLPPPIRVWKYSQANAKIRREAKSYKFKSARNGPGVIHTARLPCNEPCEDEMDVRAGQGVGGDTCLFAGIYDGHAGWATARLLAKALIPRVSRSVRGLGIDASAEDVDKAIAEAFKKLDDEIILNAQQAVEGAEAGDPAAITAIAPAVSGSCALVSIYEPATSTFRVACVGDSRAVLATQTGGSYEARALSVDQAGSDVGEGNLAEFARVRAEHPGEDGIFDKIGRLLGLMVTRAFGDQRWKTDQDLVRRVFNEFNGPAPRDNVKTPPYVTAEPVVTTTKVEGQDFVILASDGFWDHISNEDAVLCVSQWLEEKKKSGKRSGGAGKPDDDTPEPSMRHEVEYIHGHPVWFARPEHFVVEDMDNAAVHLMKNVLGGKRRKLFTSATMMYSPCARVTRDDITIQVIFFGATV